MKSRARQIIKPTPKSKTKDRDKALIIQLASLLEEAQKETDKVTVFLTSYESNVNKEKTESDLLHTLASIIHKANTGDTSEFTSSTKLDVQEPKTYKQAMYGSHGQQWAQAIKEKLDPLKKNKTQTLVPEHSIEPDHKPLSDKWVFKVKRDVNGAISRFKARWVVRGYMQQFGVNLD